MGKIVLPAGKFNHVYMSQRTGTMVFVSLALPRPVKYTFEKMPKGATLQTELTFKKDFIERGAGPEPALKRLLDESKRKGVLRFNKNDHIFLVKA